MIRIVKTYFTTFTVSGRGEFPFDMLRRDQCFPRTSEDAAAMRVPEYGRRETRSVTLISVTYTRLSAPTYGRWESFGWPVDVGSVSQEVA